MAQTFSLDGFCRGLYSLDVGNETKPRTASTPVGTLSESLEDYLEIILQLQQEKRVARVRDIAARKNVSNASVSNALARLARDGFVLHEAHEFVELTDRGAELARRVLRRHEFLVAFLHDVLLVSRDVAEADACALEHHVSAETLERLASFYQFVRTCPSAGANFVDSFRACCSTSQKSPSSVPPANLLRPSCPDTSGQPFACAGDGPQADLIALVDLKPGESGIVERLSAPSPMRERLADAGLLPNVHVELTRFTEEGDVQLSVQGCHMTMDLDEAGAILVRRT